MTPTDRFRSSSWPLCASVLCLAGLLVSCGGSGSDADSAALSNDSRKTALGVTPQQAALAKWSAVIPLTIVPSAGAVLGNGKVLMWSADDRLRFNTTSGFTFTTLFDPATNTATERRVDETGHDMFCPGTARLADGRLLVNGGINAPNTSIYDPVADTWTRAAVMKIPRGYNASTPLSDGSVFTLGGSWSGGLGGKHAEVFTEASGWRLLSGVRVDPYLLDGAASAWRGWQSDSHYWLIPTGNGQVLLAGPTPDMGWIDTNGEGFSSPAGRRGDDTPSLGGGAVMYDTGKILKTGGASWNGSVSANANAYVIDTNAGRAQVRKLTRMAYPRMFANSVVLPNGQVLVLGGQTYVTEFSDGNAVLAPEIFDPVSERFTTLPAMSVARNYHSIGLLLPDGRVISGGGGLCNCAADHPNMQILSPPYLFNADGTAATRPVVTAAPSSVGHGTSVTITTDSAVTSFAMVRMGASTHTVNNDQRRIPLTFTATSDTSYQVDVPSNAGIMLPGQWMLFAMNAQGTPSVASIVTVSNDGAPALTNPGTVETSIGASMNLPIRATSPSGTLAFSATGLPSGLSIDATTGVISGSVNGGAYVTVNVTNGSRTVSTDFLITVPNTPPPADATGCAAQDGLCAVPPGVVATVYFGASGGYANKTDIVDGLSCSSAVFGDPLPGSTKSCSYAITGTVIAPPAGAVACASEGGTCSVPASATATVYFGANGYFTRRTGVTGALACNATSFDALVADSPVATAKYCMYTVTTDGPPSAVNVPAPVASSGSTVSYAPTLTHSPGATFSWNFGDGSGDTAFTDTPDVDHVFTAPGVYTVTLTSLGSDGQSSIERFFQAVTSSGAALPGARPQASSSLLVEPRADASNRLWVANADNDSVSVFDAVANVKVTEIPVGSGPRSIASAADGQVWVVNKQAATLSIISPSTLAVVQTIALPRGSQPHGLVFSPTDGSAFVTLEASGLLLKLNGSTGAQIASLAVGSRPRHLALNAAGTVLLVSRFVTRPLPGEGTTTVNTTGPTAGADVLWVNPANLTLTRTVLLRHNDTPDSDLQGRGIPNYLGAAAISVDGKTAWVPSKQDNVLRGALRDGLALNFQSTVRAISSRIDLVTQAEDLASRVDLDNASLASAALYHPDGAYLFVALETSREVAVLDAAGKRELFRTDTGLAPQGLALSPDGSKLYVHNFTGRSVNVIDLQPLLGFGRQVAPTIATLATVGVDKLRSDVLKGKQLFYDARDPRLARDNYMSCASCHEDGGHDGRTWDFGAQGEGLRNTPALTGRSGAQGLLHWSGNFDEVQDFEGQIRAFSGGTGLMSEAAFNTGTRSQPLGDRKAGASADLDALAAYVSSLSTVAVSPLRTSTGALTTAAAAGRTVFVNRGCAACHGGSSFTLSGDASKLKSIGTLKPSSGQRLYGALPGIDIPTLRDVWATAPYLHDGSAATLGDAVKAHIQVSLTATELTNLTEYLGQLDRDDIAPTPSASLTGTATAVSTAVSLSTEGTLDWSHWGNDGVPGRVQKSTGGGRISAYAPVGTGSVDFYATDPRPISWTDGGTNRVDNRSGVLVAGQGNGFTFTVPADTTLRTLKVYVGGWRSSGVLLARLSDGSAPDYTEATTITDGAYDRTFVLSFKASKSWQTLSVTWIQTSPGEGNVTLSAAAWAGAAYVAPNRAPVITSPGTQTTIQGKPVSLKITASDPDGDAITFSATGLPNGLTLDPNTGMITGSPTDVVSGTVAVTVKDSKGLTVKASFTWTVKSFIASGTGLSGQYFSNTTFSGSPVLDRTEVPSFFWASSPGTGVPADNFSVRWTGFIEASATGDFRFRTNSDDGIRVWINGQLVIDNWVRHGDTQNFSVPMPLVANQRYAVTVEYYEVTSSGVARLAWLVPGAPDYVIVPAARLYRP